MALLSSRVPTESERPVHPRVAGAWGAGHGGATAPRERRARARPARSLLLRLLVLVVAGGVLLPVRGVAAEFPEAEVEAEFVERFTRFIDWPEGAFPGPEEPFVLCVLGEAPVEPYLQRMARTRRIKERRIEVRSLTGPAQVPGCAVLWVSRAALAQLPRVLQEAAGKPVLLVSDAEGFAQRGGHIGLRRQDTTLAFDINVAQARRSGLRFSSRLLRLGQLVGGEAP